MAQGKAVAWRATSWGAVIGVFTLFLLVGINLRAPLLSVPPVLALIRSDLGLSYSATGLLTSLPALMMGLGAWPSGRIAARIGGRLSVSLGLGLTLLGTVARGVWPNSIALYASTATLAAGIALAQTSFPLLARQWFPRRIGQATAIYTDGLVLGEAIAASVTAPLMRVWFGPNAWSAALLLWAAPISVTLLLWLWFAPPAPVTHDAPVETITPVAPPQAPLADEAAAQPAKRAHAAIASIPVSPWIIGAIMGGGSVIYFGMNGWIAPYNQALGANGMTPLALSALNTAQLPVGIAITALAQRLAGRRWPFIVAGGVALLAIVGWLLTPTTLQPLWGALIGGSSAAVFTLGFALPAIFARGAGVARLTGASLAVSYTSTFVAPFLGGVLWDTFHQPWLAFAPVMAAALALVVVATRLPNPPAV